MNLNWINSVTNNNNVKYVKHINDKNHYSGDNHYSKRDSKKGKDGFNVVYTKEERMKHCNNNGMSDCIRVYDSQTGKIIRINGLEFSKHFGHDIIRKLPKSYGQRPAQFTYGPMVILPMNSLNSLELNKVVTIEPLGVSRHHLADIPASIKDEFDINEYDNL